MIYTLTRDDIPSLSAWIKKSDKSKLVGFFGRSDGIRTHDLLVPNQAHYQTVPHPVISFIIIANLYCDVNDFMSGIFGFAEIMNCRKSSLLIFSVF